MTLQISLIKETSLKMKGSLGKKELISWRMSHSINNLKVLPVPGFHCSRELLKPHLCEGVCEGLSSPFLLF